LQSPVAGNTPQTQPENRAFFPALDGLRALAFLMVFGAHYMRMQWGWSGVDMFFVISGFLITGILFDTQDAPHRIRNFYVRRTLRIFPLYYGVFLIFLLLTPFMHWNWTLPWLAWPLYLGNYLRFWHPYVVGTLWQQAADAQLGNPVPFLYMGHFWSLCVEEQFYLFWPWVVFFVRSRRALLWICVTTVVIMPLLRVLAQHYATENMLQAELLYRVTPLRVDAMLIGGLVALLFRGDHRGLLLRAGTWLFWMCSAVALTYLILQFHLNWSFNPHWRLTWGLAFIDFYAASIMVVALQPGSILYRIFSFAPLRWLGRITYACYLFHDIYHAVVGRLVYSVIGPGHPDLMYYGVGLTGFTFTVILAYLSYRFFETPFLNLKERFTVT
jgi:peptidoglycan/LPS O-acetylase OafA/YrhL